MSFDWMEFVDFKINCMDMFWTVCMDENELGHFRPGMCSCALPNNNGVRKSMFVVVRFFEKYKLPDCILSATYYLSVRSYT